MLPCPPMKRLLVLGTILLCACGSSGDDLTDAGSQNDSSTPKDAAAQPDGGINPTDGGINPTDGSVTIDGGGGGAIKNVFMILMENHSWSSIKGNKSAPYINGLLAQGGSAENYKTPTGNHPSEPNYIWLEAGGNLGITNDNDPSSNHQATTDHLVTQLKTAGVSWKAYAEDITGSKCPLTSTGLYGAKHTPQLYFDDVTGTNDPNNAYCIAHVRPYSELATDLGGSNVARFNFITPNLCNDMHGEAIGTTCFALTTDLVKKGDDWLKANVPTILASNAYKNGGVLFILWDEGDEKLGQNASDGPIGMIVLSPLAKTNYTNNTAYTHSSMLRTVEEIFGVPLLRDAKNATDLSAFFTSFP